ncbi:hypothetical protein Tco_0323301, partial [Tanacetum coccineum]
TKAQSKRYGEELQTEISKKQRIGDKNVSDTAKRKKQKARKGISIDKSSQGDSETDKEELVKAMNPTPLDTKSNIVANWKIFQQGERSIYQIIRANRADTVYISFGAMLKDFPREDLIELYRLLMAEYYRLATPEQTATGKEYSNPLIADDLLKIIFYTSAGNPVKEILLKLNLPDHRILKDGGEDFRYSDTERLSRSDEVLKLKNFKKDATLKLSKLTNQEWYEHVGPEVTRSQDDKVTR